MRKLKDRWRFILADTPPVGAAPKVPLIRVGELDAANGRNVDFGLNRAGSAKCGLPLKDDHAYYLFKGSPKRTTISSSLIVCRGIEEMWSGPIIATSGSGSSGMMEINATGWFEILNYRELRRDMIFVGTNPRTGRKWNDADIAFALLEEANTQDPERPTWISKGNAFGPRQERERKYTKGEKIGPLIHELSVIENGFDYEVDPVTRELNIWGAGSGKGTDRKDVHFGYYFGPGNLDDFSFAEDGTSTMNRKTSYGNQGITPGLAQDTDSMDRFGVWEETSTLSNIGNSGILAAYSGAEVIVRALPKLTYTIQPFPWNPVYNIPRIGKEFFIGDIGRFSAKKGALQVFKQPVRFYGASIDITDEDTEKYSKLEISPS